MHSENNNESNFNEFKSFSEWLFSLSAFEFTSYGTVIGYLISSVLTTNQQNSLGNFFELVGQVILTFNAQNSTLQSKKNSNQNLSNHVNYENEIFENLYSKISSLEKEINSLKNKLNK